MPTKITMYQANDGSHFRTMKEAIAHEKQVEQWKLEKIQRENTRLNWSKTFETDKIDMIELRSKFDKVSIQLKDIKNKRKDLDRSYSKSPTTTKLKRIRKNNEEYNKFNEMMYSIQYKIKELKRKYRFDKRFFNK
jgi:hypothetical protein